MLCEDLEEAAFELAMPDLEDACLETPAACLFFMVRVGAIVESVGLRSLGGSW